MFGNSAKTLGIDGIKLEPLKKFHPFHWGGRSDGGSAESHSNHGRRSLRTVKKISHEALYGCDGAKGVMEELVANQLIIGRFRSKP